LPILAEGWFREPVAPLPPQGSLIIPREALVLELPFGDPFADTAAEYLAVLGGYRVLNGYSGYDAPHYGRLRESISEHRDQVFDAYRQLGDVYVIVHGSVRDADASWVIQQTGSQLVSRESGRDIYRLGYLGSGSPPSLPLPLSASTSFAIP
jgi:hypothetical protein